MSELSPAELFTRGVWKLIPETDDVSWVERIATTVGADGPVGDYGPLVRGFLSAGVPASDIARFARIVGYEVAFGLCCYLGDSTPAFEGFNDDQHEILWGLFEVDPETDEPAQSIWGVHELLLTSDPSGREMRPPPN